MRLLITILLLAAAGGGLLTLGARPGAEASTWPGCDSFDTQPVSRPVERWTTRAG